MWRTECDTPTTGMGGCRTYVKASVVVASGGGYRTEMRWVFNNLVLFSSASIRPVTAIPANILDRAVLTPTGFGPLQLGTPLSVMHGAYLARGISAATSAPPARSGPGVST
ncbi:hypothetical protein G7085_00995 [Tessaracoccus sp. HDW20]|uniref:hypothetical protein n=1 Tax=Tessaracoccus coleopterorum TaxID=2714950 RepID=UPI0018D2A18F|nr:hypothetical protein [Tessaracoccus coleopterorum]NHB83757.1 hypothetical protein [Tessaracoccus coleopterorum]